MAYGKEDSWPTESDKPTGWGALKERRDIMLCYPFEEKRLLRWPTPYIVQPKLDGERCRAVWSDERASYTLLSSSASEIISCPHIIEALNNTGLMGGEFDGELYRHGMRFEEIHSRVSRTVNFREDSDEIEFHIFDLINEAKQRARTEALEQLDELRAKPLRVVETAIAYDLEGINLLLQTFKKYDYEGIIVRNIDGLYKRKRSTEIMKFKPRKSDVYNIIGYEEEISKDGIPKQTLGALVCRDNAGNEFRVGSGFTRQQRQYYWGGREWLPGHKVKVLYQHTTNGGVPRFPIFSEVIE